MYDQEILDAACEFISYAVVAGFATSAERFNAVMQSEYEKRDTLHVS